VTIGSSVRRVVAGLVAGTLVALVLPLSGTAQAADNGAWSASPTQQGAFTARQFFFIEAAQGATVNDSITIKNASEDTLFLDVFPADAFNIETGAGFALRKRGEVNEDVGSWVKVGKEKVEVPAGGEAKVPFSMTVPKGVTPGDHAGGIVTIEPPPVPNGDASQVQIQRALGVRVYVRVAGPLTPSLTITKVDLTLKPARLPFIGQQGGATVTYTVRNTGNVRLTANRLITLKGFIGQTLHDTGQGPIPEILPGSTVTLTESFAKMPVLNQVTARVELTEDRTQVSTAGDANSWSISWVFFFLLLLLIIALGGAFWWSRREPEGLAGAPADSGPAAPEVEQVGQT